MNPLNKILLGIGAALCLLIAVVIVWLMLANAHLKTALAELQANATACHMANDQFVAAVAKQNQAVAHLKADDLAREKRVQVAEAAAQKSIRGYALAVEKLRDKKPQGDACVAAAKLFDDYVK